jgi:general secretion pathway protein L
MTFLQEVVTKFSLWIDSVAETIIAFGSSSFSSRSVQFLELPDGSFSVRSAQDVSFNESVHFQEGQITEQQSAKLSAAAKGARAEIVLQPHRFTFRPLELPLRATEFLDGIVRAQIDRLTPWRATEAVFGWSKPIEAGSDRMVLTVAATARSLVMPFLQAVTALGVESISLTTTKQNSEGGAETIKVWEQKIRGVFDIARVKLVLVLVFVASLSSAVLAIGLSSYFGGELEEQRFDVLRKVSEKRAAAFQLGRDAQKDAIAGLERHKREVPASVIVLEALSQILPDHTYVTEVRVLGDRLQIVGITRDAPSLIRLIEQSSHFTRATFFAPTTRSPTETGEHFNIEARIEPVYSANP